MSDGAAHRSQAESPSRPREKWRVRGLGHKVIDVGGRLWRRHRAIINQARDPKHPKWPYGSTRSPIVSFFGDGLEYDRGTLKSDHRVQSR